jgi:hypothetical protein
MAPRRRLSRLALPKKIADTMLRLMLAKTKIGEEEP